MNTDEKMISCCMLCSLLLHTVLAASPIQKLEAHYKIRNAVEMLHFFKNKQMTARCSLQPVLLCVGFDPTFHEKKHMLICVYNLSIPLFK